MFYIHILILHSGSNGLARTFSGTLNYSYVKAQFIFLKSMGMNIYWQALNNFIAYNFPINNR